MIDIHHLFQIEPGSKHGFETFIFRKFDFRKAIKADKIFLPNSQENLRFPNLTKRKTTRQAISFEVCEIFRKAFLQKLYFIYTLS